MVHKDLRKLIEQTIAIEEKEAKEAGALGFMARALVQATLPHSKTDQHFFRRRNGDFQLTIVSDPDIGIPYGTIPRLLLAWLTTEAVKTQRREIILGKSLSDFMEQLDLIPTGGRWGSITRLREQMKRLFSAGISCTYNEGNNWSIRNVTPVSRANLWWDPKQPQQFTLFESNLVLGEDFFREIINYPIPIDMRALKALKRSPMAIDIYHWLTYRMSYLKSSSNVSWLTLQNQFGADYSRTRDFKRRFIQQLKDVILVYNGANIELIDDGLLLKPGKAHIKTIPKIVVDK